MRVSQPEQMRWRLVHALTGLVLIFVGSCGGGGGSGLVTAVDPTADPGSAPAASASIQGRVLDPFSLCASASPLIEAGVCSVLSGPAFPPGSTATLYRLNERGSILQPPLGTATVDVESEFFIPFDGSLFNPPGTVVQVSNGFELLHGFVFSAAVDVSVWSEAVYQILLSENALFANYTASEIRDLENILRVKVAISSQAITLDEVVQQVISDGFPEIEELVEVCYAPEGNQTDQPCRLSLPLPSPEELDEFVSFTITNTAVLAVNGVRVESNTVRLTVE